MKYLKFLRSGSTASTIPKSTNETVPFLKLTCVHNYIPKTELKRVFYHIYKKRGIIVSFEVILNF